MTYNATIQKLVDDGKMPARIRKLPISEKGYPVPWFVSRIDGEWNFVGVDPRKPMIAHVRGLCWVCGEKLGTRRSFVIGPMCAINRVTSEPPSHKECAEFSAVACPFLSKPKMTRNYKAMPEEERVETPGIPIDRNPGVCLIWTTKHYKLREIHNGYLFFLGNPIDTSWWCNGRTATKEEVDESIAGGLPILKGMAESEGSEAVAELNKRIKMAEPMLPR